MRAGKLVLNLVILLALGAVTGMAYQEVGKEKKEEKKDAKPDGKSITVRFNISLDVDSQITVDDQPCSLQEAETLYKFAPGALQTAEMKVTDGKATLLKVITKK